MAWTKTKFPSVYVRHAKACAAPEGRCRCTPSYFAQARSKTTGKIIKSKVVYDINEATGWLADMKRGRIAERTNSVTFGDLVEEFIDACERGLIRPKRSESWAPSTLRTYRCSYERHVRDDYADRPAADLTAEDWQGLIDRLHEAGQSTNSIATILMVVRSTYRWACAPTRRKLTVNATAGLELPVPDEKARDRIATPDEAVQLLGVLSGAVATAYALALYGGLRRVEMFAATWDWIDFDRGVIDVRVSKTKKGIRLVPMAGPLRAMLLKERARLGAFNPESPVVTTSYGIMLRVAKAAFAAANLNPIGLHECRHTYASFMIAAGVNAKAISVYMGHADVGITFNRYGHLMPGNEQEAADLLDAYLKRGAA